MKFLSIPIVKLIADQRLIVLLQDMIDFLFLHWVENVDGGSFCPFPLILELTPN